VLAEPIQMAKPSSKGSIATVPGVIPDAYPLPLMRDCILFYDFQEVISADGCTIIDHSGRGNHGVNNGSVSAIGPFGRVREFDGVDDTIDTLHRFLGPWDFSIVFWFKMTAGGGTQDRWFKQGADCTLYWRDLANDGKLIFKASEFDEATSADDSVPLDQWTMGALTAKNVDADDLTANLYVNGKLSGDVDQNVHGVIGDVHTIIGGNVTFQAKGQLGWVMIFDRVLNAAEIANLYQQDAWRYGLAA